MIILYSTTDKIRGYLKVVILWTICYALYVVYFVDYNIQIDNTLTKVQTTIMIKIQVIVILKTISTNIFFGECDWNGNVIC